MKHHAYANLFPMLSDEKLSELAEDIEKNGQREPILLLDGKVLDGRNRMAACKLKGIEPITKIVTDIEDPVAYVLSLNLHRRHLTPSQASMCAARARELYEQQAKERQQARKGNQAGASPENLPELKPSDARDAAGKAFGVSGKSVDYAKKVIDKGIPELAKAVDEGRMAVSTAASLAEMPVTKQQELIEVGVKAVKKGAAKSRKSKPCQENVLVPSCDNIHDVLRDFPPLEAAIQELFTNDIRKYGQRTPVLIDEDGVLLDGRSRVVACQELGIPVRYEIFRGTESEKEAIIYSLNLTRRPMTISQLAMFLACAGL
jgi:ParB-like chromosome segregation protein Spo0J